MGVTTSSYRSRTARTRRRSPGSVTASSIGRTRAACCTSHGRRRIMLGWMKVRRATPSRAVVSPHPTRASSDRVRGSSRARPGSTSYARTQLVPAADVQGERSPVTSSSDRPEARASDVRRGWATASPGSARTACRATSASMSSVAGSSAGFETLSTARPAPASSRSRNVWSRSLPRLRAAADRMPKVAAPISTAWSVVNAGGWDSRTASIDSSVGSAGMAHNVPAAGRREAVLTAAGRRCPGSPARWPARARPERRAGRAARCPPRRSRADRAGRGARTGRPEPDSRPAP